jgi:hypothetical protein
MTEPFDIKIDTDSFATTYLFSGEFQYQNQYYPFTVCTGEDNVFIDLIWRESDPPDDIIYEVQRQIIENF